MSYCPQPEVVYLKATGFALVTALSLPGQQRLSVCLPRPSRAPSLAATRARSTYKSPGSSQRLPTDGI